MLTPRSLDTPERHHFGGGKKMTPFRTLFCGGLGWLTTLAAAPFAHASPGTAPQLAHREARFEFTAHGPIAQVAPLFGAYREQVWSSEWKPQFLYPSPAADRAGMVFTVAHGDLHSVWVNTRLEPATGVVQYVYVVPEAMVTVITLQLTPVGRDTHVAVEYDRTALNANANRHVEQLADDDRRAGPDWEHDINQYLLHQRLPRS
jgi:hypothetical protein